MKKSRLARGQRQTPSWVAERMEDRPPWRCRNDDERQGFKEFILQELALREFTHATDESEWFKEAINQPKPIDGRQKPWLQKAFQGPEAAARAIPIIREIFEDYWADGRDAGRVYRGHDPSAEEIAADYADVTVDDVQRVMKRSKAKRPDWK